MTDLGKHKLITNNPLAAEKYQTADVDINFIDGTAVDVLTEARNLVHLGHALMTHPLSSSIPRKDSPYKSVLLSGAADKLDFNSLNLIEGAIGAYGYDALKININPSVAEDFMVIDCGMISHAAEKLKN